MEAEGFKAFTLEGPGFRYHLLNSPAVEGTIALFLAGGDPAQQQLNTVPASIRAHAPPWVLYPADPIVSLEAFAYGWPFPAFGEARWRSSLMGQEETAGALPWRKPVPGDQRGALDGTLPLSPIWVGLIADAALGAALIWASIFLFRHLRVLIRRRRGACERCNYDLSGLGSVCPECGFHSAPHSGHRSV
jgi:hypothetical protein